MTGKKPPVTASGHRPPLSRALAGAVGLAAVGLGAAALSGVAGESWMISFPALLLGVLCVWGLARGLERTGFVGHRAPDIGVGLLRGGKLSNRMSSTGIGLLIGACIRVLLAGGHKEPFDWQDMDITVVVGFPLLEEVIYRLCMWRWLRPRGLTISLLWTSILFVAVHVPQRLHWIQAAPGWFWGSMLLTFVWSVVFGLCREFLGFPAAVGAHVGDNLTAGLGWW